MNQSTPVKYRVGKLLPPLFLFALGIFFSFTHGLERWDRYFYDYLSGFSTRPGTDTIIIIAIDEDSLARYGRWPWSRKIHADLINKLTAGGARAIGFDIVIAEAGHRAPENDILLAEAVARNGRIIMPVLGELNPATNRLQLTRPLPVIADAAAGLGHVDYELDADGIMRRTYLMAGLGHPDWQALPLAMLHFADPAATENLPGKRNRNLRSASPENWIRDYEVLIPFAGKPGHFRRISYSRFLEPGFDPAVVKDKFVLVGTTAMGLSDALPTPVSGESVPMAGVEINANLLDALKHGLLIEPLAAWKRVMLTGILLLIPLLLYPFLSERSGQGMIVIALLLVVLVSSLLLRNMHLWFPPAAAMLALLLSYLLWTWRRLGNLVRKLFREKERALVTLHSIGDGVITTDTDCRVEFMNPVAERLTGFTTEESRGIPIKEILPIRDEDLGREYTDIVRDCLHRSEILHLHDEAVFFDRSGKEHFVSVSAGPIRDDKGLPLGVVLGITDVTEKKYALRKLSYQATHDFLTGLPNRSLLTDRLYKAIINAQRGGYFAAVLFLDLDLFKKINDQLGHAGGDRLLQMVGERLKGACREEDTVARIGGDEFVVVLERMSSLRTVANVANKLIHLLASPFIIDGHELYLTVSIGISVYPKDGDNAELLMKNADIAMYEVKKSGRNAYLFFSTDMNELIQKKLRLEAQLRSALKNNRLAVYYQPQVRLTDNRIIGVEALLRWITIDNDFISPAIFIPVAEEDNLIFSLSEWVLFTACRQARIWQDELQYPMGISVNISPKQFMIDDLPEQLERIIRETGINPGNLDLEITEGLIMQDVKRSTAILGEFKRLGGTVSIDDFGTGYSSLSYLKKFPLDKLKIDKSFVDEIDKNSKDEGLAKTIITMGHGLNLSVVAEGVETGDQLAVLKKHYCDIIQGFYFSRPLPADMITDLLKRSPYLFMRQDPSRTPSAHLNGP